MERAVHAGHDGDKEAVQPEAEIAPPENGRFENGVLPAVAQGERAQGETASEQAFGDRKTNRKVATETTKVLQYIRSQAKLKAAEPMHIGKDSLLYKRLESHYLADYLAAPSPATGTAAVAKVGEQLDPLEADPTDYWERGASSWNAHPVPESVKLLLPHAPSEMGAATSALSGANRAHMPYIDAPQMIGSPNTDVGENADVYGGGKNVSQLMHWATGVKHSANDPQTMRDLFLAYEMYHLEGWDKFGEDSINDMISEEGGRIMGRQLQAGEINRENLGSKLDDGMNESRAWVGSLIKARQGDLDAVITSQSIVESEMWYGALGAVRWWGDSTIYMDLAAGKSVEEVQADSRTQHFIDIYALVYYTDIWQKQHKRIAHSAFTNSMLAGKYNTVFEKSVMGEPLTKDEKFDAYMDAKAPWVPRFVRNLAKKLPMVNRKLGSDEIQATDEPEEIDELEEIEQQ